MEAVEAHFDIKKQKVILIIKCKEQDEEVAGNALTTNFLLLPSS